MATATLAASLRSLGRAGMFSLSVLRASLPTRDFFAELSRDASAQSGMSLTFQA